MRMQLYNSYLLFGKLVVDRAAHLLNSLDRVFGRENGSTGNEDITASLGTLARVASSDATIDLDVLVREALAQVLTFRKALWHELLSTVPRLDSHDQQKVGGITQLLGNHVRFRVGADGQTCRHAVLFDQGDDLQYFLGAG